MSRKAFTLVELLISMAVLGLLIALLLPGLARARESARRVRCASNLRQLATAILSYCDDNHGLMPGIASNPQLKWDWIYWATSDHAWVESGVVHHEFGRGPLIKYLGHPEPAVFRCPSDEWQLHPTPSDGAHYDRYPYSYQLNVFIGNAPVNCCTATRRKAWGVRYAADKVLLVEGDERTIGDGAWYPPLYASGHSHLADRHDRHTLRPADNFRTNLAFLDSHVEFLPRSFADDPVHNTPDRSAALFEIPSYFQR